MVRKMQDAQKKRKLCFKNEIHKPRDNFEMGCVVQTNSRLRLRGGRDHVWMSPSLDSNITNVASINKELYHPLQEFTENVGDTEKIKWKRSLQHSVKVGIRNIKQMQYAPAKSQKLIVPRNNTKLSSPMLKNTYIDGTVDSSSTLVMKRRANIKKILGDSQKKKLQSKFIHELPNKRNTLNKTALKNVSKFSILLLYLHFLFCYYLSFTKTQQFVELFETCTTEAI